MATPILCFCTHWSNIISKQYSLNDKNTSGDLLHNAKWFQTVGLYAPSSDQGTDKVPRGAQAGLYIRASVVGETNEVNFKVCIMSTICRGVLNLF